MKKLIAFSLFVTFAAAPLMAFDRPSRRDREYLAAGAALGLVFHKPVKRAVKASAKKTAKVVKAFAKGAKATGKASKL